MNLLKIDLRKIFTLFIILFPIIYIYNFYKTISVADLLLFIIVITLFFDLVYFKKELKVNYVLFSISVIISFQTLVYYCLGISNIAATLTAFRVIVYYIVCAFFINNYFDFTFGINCLKQVSFIASCFCLIQYVLFNFFGIFIQGTIPGITTQVDLYNSIMKAGAWTSYAYARPRSFFSEPSHLSIYVILGLLFYLYNYNKRDAIKIWIMICSILLSGSGMGIVSLIILLFSLSGRFIKRMNKKKIIYTIIFIAFIFVILPFYMKTESFQTFFNRTFIEKDSTEGRFGNFWGAFNLNKDIFKIIFGEGIYKIADVSGQKYITSIPRVYTYFGVVGLLSFVILLVRNFISFKGVKFYVWLLLFSICFSSEILFNCLVVIYIPFIILDDNEQENNISFKY